MKSSFSSLEIRYLVQEFQELIGAKIEQFYQIGKEELIIVFHVPGTGKRTLRIINGVVAYFSSEKPAVPQTPPGFCTYLRKHCKNARIGAVQQIRSERVISLTIDTKDKQVVLYVELFGGGNIVACSENKILSLLIHKTWKDRTLRPGQQYKAPEKEDMFTIDEATFSTIVSSSEKESVVKALAMDIGLGGTYAEELCARTELDKNTPPAGVAALTGLYTAFKEIIDAPVQPAVVLKGDKKEIIPIDLKIYADLQKTSYASFNAAIDSVYSIVMEKQEAEAAVATTKTKQSKIEVMLEEQQRSLKGLLISEKENQKKGELLYERYQEVQQVLEEIKTYKKTMSWNDIKEKLKNHPLIKRIDEAKGEMVLEL